MDLISLTIGILVGLPLGLIVALVWHRSESSRKAEKLIELSSMVSRLEEQVAARDRELEIKSTEAKAQEQRLNEIKETLKVELENASRKFLEENSNKLSQQSRQNFEHLVKPFNEELKDLRTNIRDVYDKESRERLSLKKEIEQMLKAQETLSLNAASLTTALKGDAKAQGDWGEIKLERLLELSGLQEGLEWVRQGVGLGLKDGDGQSRKPDITILLPEERNVIVDSKVSLSAYYKYIEADDEQSRALAIKEFLTSIKKHIGDLSQKEYQNLDGLNSPDYVIMFMPTDGSLSLALSQDPELYQSALSKKIMLVSPAFLSPLLKTVELLWRQDRQSKHAVEIAERGGALYDKFVGFVVDLENVGKKMGEADQAFAAAFNKLSTGHGNLLGQVEKLRALGAKAKKKLPDGLLEN